MAVPVLAVAQMREWEKTTWDSGVEEDDVMRRAGEAVAKLAAHLTRAGDTVLFLAGKGHNGDDAAYGFEFLSDRGKELLRVTDPEASTPEMVARLQGKPTLVVDGLFGIGLNRPLSEGWAKLIKRINEAAARVLAVDVPSGLNADTGKPFDVAIRAACTLTFGAVKQGLLKTSAAPFVGRLEVAADIGLLSCPFTTDVSLTSPEDFPSFPPRRPVTGHKGTFGHLAIIAGSLGYHGAAVLAARGAQRAQPGIITLLTEEAVYLPVASQLQSVMVRPWLEDLALPSSCTAILIGPGLANPNVPKWIQEGVRSLWLNSRLAVVVDASALEWIPTGPVPGDAVRVITPHPGEAARMLRVSNAEVQRDRTEATRELSKRWGGCHVVLKGHQTVVGREKANLFVNNSGNPYLAQGGSGDLLAGYLGGLLAQPELLSDPGLTLRFGVWQHGASADALLATERSFTVEDLAEVLGSARA